jgi:hypothetical protein
MPNSSIPASSEAMPKLSRRNALGLIAAVSIASPVSASGSAASITRENPDLIAAYASFNAAQTELVAAQDALGWLADEWKHRWPLAPEEILGNANADRGYSYGTRAECDIVGRYIYRDTSELTTRLTKAFRLEQPRICFSVETPDLIQLEIDVWSVPRKGRSASAIARRQAEQKRRLAKLHQALAVSTEYHKETAHLREASGVEAAKERVERARVALRTTSLAVSKAKALTTDGIRMKADALKSDDLVPVVLKQNGILGDMARFIDDVLAVIGRAST